MLEDLNLEIVRSAHGRIVSYVLRTPLLRVTTCIKGDERVGELYLKAENLQPVGAFKIRGAFSFMTTLPSDCRGVVTHSSGNHAQAVARASRVLGIPASIVMPENAPQMKRDAVELEVERGGVTIVTVGPDSNERRKVAINIAENDGLVLVPPYDHLLVAAGQGTAALEMCEDIVGMGEEMDRFYAPISGGGLMAGCATVVSAMFPDAEIVGVEPVNGADTKKSLEVGRRVAVPPPETIADGLRVRIPGEKTFPVLQRYVNRVETVCDEELLRTMGYALRELRVVLEPSGAAALAVALREGVGRCGVILSGGNLDTALLADVIDMVARKEDQHQ